MYIISEIVHFLRLLPTEALLLLLIFGDNAQIWDEGTNKRCSSG